jgi:hypothetical protein
MLNYILSGVYRAALPSPTKTPGRPQAVLVYILAWRPPLVRFLLGAQTSKGECSIWALSLACLANFKNLLCFWTRVKDWHYESPNKSNQCPDPSVINSVRLEWSSQCVHP